MSNRVLTRDLSDSRDRQNQGQTLPAEIVKARDIDWAVHIDAYLTQAAKVGDRYVALVYGDRSGVSLDGMTVATPPIECVLVRGGFKLMRSVGGDYYVIASEQGT